MFALIMALAFVFLLTGGPVLLVGAWKEQEDLVRTGAAVLGISFGCFLGALIVAWGT